jgi:hypothetical protein
MPRLKEKGSPHLSQEKKMKEHLKIKRESSTRAPKSGALVQDDTA